jgi:HK97 gp10 family phage protein
MKFNGLDEALANLRKIPKQVVQEALEPALIAAAQPIVSALASQTPVKTSELLNHLMFAISIDPATGKGVARVGFGKLGYVARFVELGHKNIGHEPQHKDYGNVKPHVFMRPAFAESIGDATEAFTKTIKTTLETGGLTFKRAA